MRDFTLKTYRQLLEALLSKGYEFVRFDECAGRKPFVSAQDDKTQGAERNSPSAMRYALCVLRHDVDRLPENALAMAQMESELGIKGTYYFRIVPESFDEKIIKQIAGLGHEIGYHYEEMDIASRQLAVGSWQMKGKWSMLNVQYKKRDNETGFSRQAAVGNRQNKSQYTPPKTNNQQPTPDNQQPASNNPPPTIIDLAYEMFKENLEKLRNIAPVTTICMHGSPLSPYDNKEIWKKYDYRKLGIIGEPYFDIDWNEFGYLTDTGRCWNGSDVSVRDKVSSKNAQFSIINSQLSSTKDLINAIEQNKLPDKLMITVHPQRWTDSWIAWVHEFVWQNVKNVGKKALVLRGRRSEVRSQRSEVGGQKSVIRDRKSDRIIK